MSGNNTEKAEYLLKCLEETVKNLEKNENNKDYSAFLHGQAYGIAMSLKELFPGRDNWGEKAAFLIRPVLSEHKCRE